MNNIVLPADCSRRLVFYLAMEEWVCSRLHEGFFVWQVKPTVILGRNQDLLSEVNVPFCKDNGIEYYRRRSGGGCVYSDAGNIMISCVTRSTNVSEAFVSYLETLCSLLRSLGLDAVRSEHNDVLVNGFKVSGNACFSAPGGSIVHGTLLYDTDFSVLEKAITPSREKLQKHSVQSVRQRVANLTDFAFALPIEDLKSCIVSYFTDSEYVLNPSEMLEIQEIENSYLEPSFLLGKEGRKSYF